MGISLYQFFKKARYLFKELNNFPETVVISVYADRRAMYV